jgi:hypothetical protein
MPIDALRADGPRPDAPTTDALPPPPDAGGPCVGCPPCVEGGSLTAFERTLIELPPQTWYQAPASHLVDVCVPDGVAGVIGCRGITAAWSGGAYDSTRRRMIVWGGGHDDYWGNELYGFDMRTGSWSRLTEPSQIPEGETSESFFNRDPLSDGQPASRHTYDGVEFLPDVDLLWAHGGSRARDGNGTTVTWVYDDATGWSQRAVGVGGYDLATAYDPSSQKVMVLASESLHVYDVAADTWTALPGWGYPPLWPRYAYGGDRTGVVDPTRGLFWAVGNGTVLVWDIAAATAVTDSWPTTGGGDHSNRARLGETYPDQVFESGGGAVYDVSAPGIDYDSASDALVAWPNDGAPYALDLETREWTIGGASGAPTSANSGGTFGRWRYVDAYNVFVLVNAVDENVHFYKHTSGCGPG